MSGKKVAVERNIYFIDGRYRVVVGFKGRGRYIGQYTDLEEARQVRDDAKAKFKALKTTSNSRVDKIIAAIR